MYRLWPFCFFFFFFAFLSRYLYAQREAEYPPQNEARVVRDVYNVHTRYRSLYPRLDRYTSDKGTTQKLLVLDGTVPIVYRGSSYNIPIRIWIMSYHPSGPPTIYVKPTPDMVVLERHDHVDRNGLVYLPYLSEWNEHESTTLGAIAAMSQVFSIQPPVYSNHRSSNSSSQQQHERQTLITRLTYRCKERLQYANNEGLEEIQQLLRQEEALGNKESVPEAVRDRIKKRDELEASFNALVREEEQLEAFIANNNVHEGDIDVDSKIHPKDVHSEQILQCLSMDSALTDAMDQLMEACCAQRINVEQFTKETKRIARQQFFKRALLRKVRLEQAHQAQAQQAQAQAN